MKTIIICESTSHGNTLQVANAMAEIFAAKIVKPSEFDIDTAAEYDLIGLGSGIYHGKHHKNLMELAKSLPRLEKSVFIFSTSGKGNIAQHEKLRAIVSEKGYSNAGEFTCKALDTWGPLKFIGGINKGLPNEETIRKGQGLRPQHSRIDRHGVTISHAFASRALFSSSVKGNSLSTCRTLATSCFNSSRDRTSTPPVAAAMATLSLTIFLIRPTASVKACLVVASPYFFTKAVKSILKNKEDKNKMVSRENRVSFEKTQPLTSVMRQVSSNTPGWHIAQECLSVQRL